MSTDRVFELHRVFGSTPWLKVRERRDYRVKVFQSGNSVALRLPAELGLKPGLEMNLRVENGEIVSVEPVERPKRKFNAVKVAGSASDLTLLTDADRTFADRPLSWQGRDDGSAA